MVVAAALQDILNRAIAGDDEDGENFYDKIPEYIKRNNLIIMNPMGGKGDYIKIPAPFVYNFATTVGRVLNATTTGQLKPSEGMFNIVESGFDTFNPTGTAENAFDTVTPSAIRPWAQSMMNKSGRVRQLCLMTIRSPRINHQTRINISNL